MATEDTPSPAQPGAGQPNEDLGNRPLPVETTDLRDLGAHAQGQLGPTDEPRVEPDAVNETVGTGSVFAIGCVIATVVVILVAVAIFVLTR
ncbi:MAG: hypothetical protein M3Q71_10040 [Chloroflexota bacterium]|nr:hypothetical protein [Chloroflexota bacterium]MDP9470990.1 hypothetical protein [Chloroflexota bacterium]